MTSKYEELRDAIKLYGEAAMENLVRCKALGNAVINGLAEWLECPPENVAAVPPAGQFDPRKNYGEAAFSYHAQPVIRLEPVVFGVCVSIKNVEDSGSLWLRTAIRVEVTGDTFDVYVANQPTVRIPLEFTGQLAPVYEAIYKELINVFKMELEEFQDSRYERSIGFFLE